jgi:hypothetical protein
MKLRRMRLTGYVAQIEWKRNKYSLLVGKPEGKRPLGRQKRRWVDNIKLDLGEIGWGGVDWIGLDQDRGKSSEFGNELSASMKCWETIEWLHNWWSLYSIE